MKYEQIRLFVCRDFRVISIRPQLLEADNFKLYRYRANWSMGSVNNHQSKEIKGG